MTSTLTLCRGKENENRGGEMKGIQVNNYIASYLMLKDIEPVDVVVKKGGRIRYVFPRTEEVQSRIRDFNEVVNILWTCFVVDEVKRKRGGEYEGKRCNS